MREFNLIPQSYHVKRVRMQMLRVGSVTLAALLLSGIAAYGVLNQWLDIVNSEVAEFQQQQAVSSRQGELLTTLNIEKKRLNQQWQLLESLRSGMPAKQMMESVQATMRHNEVWFIDWRLRRAGVITEKETAANQPGYFVIVKRTVNPEDWQSMTHMTIRGQARDHSTLSEFAQRLLNQPDIEDVRVQKTTRRAGRNQELEAVDFDLAIVLKTEFGNS
jgi:hypothetical protein